MGLAEWIINRLHLFCSLLFFKYFAACIYLLNELLHCNFYVVRYSAPEMLLQNRTSYPPPRSPYLHRHAHSTFIPCSTSRPSSHHGTPTRRYRQTSTLLASLDKSILQIRDWLALLEDMMEKEKVDIMDIGQICRLLERQRVSDTQVKIFLAIVHNLISCIHIC